jgi:hypothetical protein
LSSRPSLHRALHPATPDARNENVPDALPPARAAQTRALVGAARRPRRVQRGPRYGRLAPLSHHRQAVRRLATRAPRPAGHGRHGPQWWWRQRQRASVLDLGNEKDVADYVLRARGGGTSVDGGYETAASEVSSVAEGEDAEDVVSLAEDYVGRNNRKGQKRAVRLDEIGPRMEMRLVKITEGVPGKEGAVIYHEFGEWLRSSGLGWRPHPIDSVCARLYLFRFCSQEDKGGDCGSKRIARCQGKLRKERREEQIGTYNAKRPWRGRQGRTLRVQLTRRGRMA